MKRLFHRTWAEAAAEILRHGFVDGAPGHVWVSDTPVPADEMKGDRGGGGDIVLSIDLPQEVVDAFQAIPRSGYTAFKIPAEQLNMGRVTFSSSDYAGLPRDQLVQFLKDAEAAEAKGTSKGPPNSKWAKAAMYREAVSFLDRFAPLS